MHERILQSLYRAIDEINLQRPRRDHLAKSDDTQLTNLDSLAFANFVVLVEQEIDREFNASINLLEEGSLLDSSQGPQTVGSLAEMIVRIVDKGKDD